MKKFFAIFEVYFISMLTSFSRRKLLRIPALTALLVIGGIVFYFLTRFAVFIFGVNLPAPLSTIDFGPIILNSIMLAMLIFLFLGSFTIILSTLYLSSDIKSLLSMPISERIIFSAKFTFANFEESLYPLFLVYPFFVGFGIKYHLGVLFYITSLFFSIFLPLIPFAIAALIVIPLAYRMSVKKLQTIALVLNMLFGVFIYLVTQIANPAFHIVNSNDIPSLLNKTQGILKLLPTNVAVSFSYAFKNGHSFRGFTEVLLFIGIGAVLFFIALVFAQKNYAAGLFRAERIESVKFISSRAEKQILGGRLLSRHIGALISKDLKVLLRDPHIKTSVFMSLGYVGFFLFVFLISPMKNSGKSSYEATFMPILYFVIVDFMLCGQNALIMLLSDRESIWVPFMSGIQSNEFIWSKFLIPFISGEILNILLFVISIFLVKGSSAKLLFVTLPFAIFLPLLFTASAIFVGMMFPNFKTPPDPRKLVSGKAALLNGLLYFIYVVIAVIMGIFSSFLVKATGISSAVIIMFFLVGVLSVAISFPLITVAIKKYKEMEISN